MTPPDQGRASITPERTRASELPPPLTERLRSWPRLKLAAEVLAIYANVRWQLARKDLPAAVDALRRLAVGPPKEVSERTYFEAGRLAWAVQRTLRVVPTDSRCLMQSLVLTRLLARRGISSSLVIGVRPAGEFEAHAWVEYCERALLPGDQGIYEPLTEL